MQPVPPFWFKQRQCNIEPAGDNMLKLTGPILPDAYLRVEPVQDGKWLAALRMSPDGADERTTTDLPAEKEAWDAAFELYRLHLIT